VYGGLIPESGEAKENDGEAKDSDDVKATTPQVGHETSDKAVAS